MAVTRMMAAGLALALLPALAWSATVRQQECLDTTTSMSLFPAWMQTAQGGIAQGHATNFTIVYHDTYKTIYNFIPNETYVLYQCGTTPPSSSDPDVPAGAKVFQVPVQQIMVTDTTAVALLSAIGVLDRVSYTSGNSVNSCMQKLLAANSTVCNSPSRTASYVSSSNPTFLSQLATVDAEFGWDASKLTKTVAIRAPNEPTPLRRMEWVKMVAAFFNKESTANDYYNQVSASYAAVKAAAATAGKARSATPKVAWLYFSPGYTYQGVTYPDTWQLSWASYKNAFIQDAGGDLLDFAATVAAVVDGASVNNYGTDIYFDKPAGAAALHQVLAGADFVIDSSAYPGVLAANITFQAFLDMYGYNASQVNSTKFLAAGNIIRLDGVVSADGVNWAWFEDAVARPDQVLRDLVSLITPGAFASISATPPVYAKAIGAANRVVPVLPSACTSTLSATTCTYAYDPICPTVHKACNGSLVYATAAEPCTPTSCPSPSSPSNNVTAPPPPPGNAAASNSHLSMLTAFLALAAVLMAMMA